MKILGRLALVAAIVGATFAVAAPADAVNGDCYPTALIPYKSGSSVVYGGWVNCSLPNSGNIHGTEQRQGTGNWASLSSQWSPSYYNSTSFTLTATNGVCTPAGTHTFRSLDTFYVGANSATLQSSGRSISC
jgi:hypothetical protein